MSLPAYSPSLPAYSPSAVASSSKLTLDLIQPCRPLETPSHYLPHLVRSVAALKPSKASVSLCLAEDTVFVRPRRRFEDLDAADDDWSCGGQRRNKDGPGGAMLRGFVSVVSTSRRTVDDVCVSLKAEGRLAIQGGPPESYVAFERSLSLAEVAGLECIQLVKGINTFEFSLRVPNSCPASIPASPFGGLRHVLSAHIVGSGSLLKADLAASKEVSVVHLPDRIDGPDLSFEDEVSDDLPWSGPQRVQVSAAALTIGGRVDVHLALPCPADDVTIYGARAYVCQTIRTRSTSGETQTVTGSKRALFQRGYLEGWQAADFATRAAEKHGAELLLVPGRPLAEKEDGWSLAGSGMLDSALRPTTLAAAKNAASTASLSFSSELVVEIFFSQRGSGAGPDDGRLMLATVYRKPVTLLSAKCAGDSLTLPEYAA